ncbi:uncharacterized protein FIBRA_02435 [Fibroporia radiculosa]|uniref:RPEL repeat protein n=1 Tax=Fibroporia radiculosa TaxID=599839 RepID=J4GMV8_9APHY|nr:uncharacterized protein FIBRA_02435 [Fibroporia radiculosa]CCM00405.1 predicted protein [Fibroporia radiculosa]
MPMSSAESNPTRPTPARKPSVDPETVEKLERRLSLRPDKQDLVERNILKESNVAPSLQAAKDRLERSQLEDKLEHALQQRPKAEELVKDGILQSTQTLFGMIIATNNSAQVTKSRPPESHYAAQGLPTVLSYAV